MHSTNSGQVEYFYIWNVGASISVNRLINITYLYDDYFRIVTDLTVIEVIEDPFNIEVNSFTNTKCNHIT
jgi:hypothetical protein